MYFTNIRHHSNASFICAVENSQLNEIDGDDCASIIGTYGAVYFNTPFTDQQLRSWMFDLGYYLNDKIPPRDYNNFDTGLSLYPDNEEILIIHNNSDHEILISLINSANSPSDLLNWNTWNLYDDIWITVTNKNFDASNIKSISESKNFDTKNKPLYKPVRVNHSQHYKLLPRHPLHTACMFSPKKHIIEMKTYNEKILPNHGEMIEGISTRLYNKQYKKQVKIQPNHCLIVDQIITQWKLDQGNIHDLNLIPLWYKTNIRKHFNYSL